MRSYQVLIVEDEPRMRELLMRAIPDMGFDVAAVRSAEEAAKLIEAQPVDILILDLNLPGKGGLEFLAQVRLEHPLVQAVILTGLGDLPAAQQAMRLDAVDFLTKPTPLGELEKSLERARRRVDAMQQPAASRIEPIVNLPLTSHRDQEASESTPAEPESAASRTLADLEREHILAALERHAGNRSATASELGISLRTLYYRLSEYEKQGFLESEEGLQE